MGRKEGGREGGIEGRKERGTGVGLDRQKEEDRERKK